MDYNVKKHWINTEYFVIVRNNLIAFSKFTSFCFFYLFEQKIIDFEYMKNNFNAFLGEDEVMLFKTKKEAQRVIDELLLPYIIMERLME